MASEIIQNQKYDGKADLWSVGAILFQPVTGRPPFNGNSQLQLFQNILTSTELRFPPEALKELDSDCLDLCRSLLRQNPAFSKVKSDDPEWFFFSPCGLKYPNSKRSNRATKAGYWKATGEVRNIKIRGTNNVMGTKKTLFFYKGRGPHVSRTNWVIYEYHAVTFPVDKRTLVLCRLIEKTRADGGTDALIHDAGESSRHIATDYDEAAADRIPDVYTLPEENLESIFLAPPQAVEYDFPSLEQSPIVTEQEPYIQDSTFSNANFGNENNIKQFPIPACIQSRGRARKPGSDYILMVERGYLPHEAFLRNARNSEETLRKEAIERTDLSHLKDTSRLIL